MKGIRSTKCSLKFATDSKIKKLQEVLQEYGNVTNYFINMFWHMKEVPKKAGLLKGVVNSSDSWFTHRLKKVSAREAIDMILASRNRDKEKAVMPVHRGKRMHVSCTIADLILSKQANEFDAWLHLSSIGNKISPDLPIKYHKHFNKYNYMGRRLNSYIITKNYVQISFEIITEEKKEVHKAIGIDTGIKALASTSTGHQYGTDMQKCIDRVKRCKPKSKGKHRAIRALKQRIDEVVHEVFNKEQPDLIVVEKLKNLNKKTKIKRRLNKNIRRSIGIWNWKYWLKRLQELTELNRVSFRSVPPKYTSTTCQKCGHADRRNRNGEEFTCQSCGYTDNADLNAAVNILERFLTGPYGACCKPENISIL